MCAALRRISWERVHSAENAILVACWQLQWRHRLTLSFCTPLLSAGHTAGGFGLWHTGGAWP
jgi:hypothetical protein